MHYKLLALVNALGDCSHLLTVDVHFTDWSKSNEEKVTPLQLNNILYPLSKLQAMGLDCKLSRTVTFHGFPREAQDFLDLTQRVAAKFQQPKYPNVFRILNTINIGISTTRRPMLEAAETDPLFDVFLVAFDSIVAEDDLSYLADHVPDCFFSGKVKSPLSVYEADVV